MEEIDDVDNEIMLVAVVAVDCRPLTCHPLVAVARVNTGFAFTSQCIVSCISWMHLTTLREDANISNVENKINKKHPLGLHSLSQ